VTGTPTVLTSVMRVLVSLISSSRSARAGSVRTRSDCLRTPDQSDGTVAAREPDRPSR